MALTVSTVNPRYFEDANGNLVYLAGYYDNFSPQSGGDWADVLANIGASGPNCARLWARHHGESTPYTFTYNAGTGKFDLDTPSTTYLAALRSACEDLDALGAYAIVMFWQGWSLIDDGWGNKFDTCAFKSSLNINGVNGDWYNSDGNGLEVDEVYGHTATSLTGAGAAELAVRTAQRTYIRAIIDALNDLDNIIWEVSNEDRFTNPNKIFQEWVANEIRTYEAGKAKQHPVGITSHYDGSTSVNPWLRTTSADWIAPNHEENFDTAPPANDGTKIVLADTDHIWSDLTTLTVDWTWRAALRGNHPLFLSNRTIGAGAVAALGHTRQYLARLTLASVTPSSSGYILSWNGREYLIYSPNTGSFVASLASGNYTIEWFNPTTGVVASTGSYAAVDGNNTLTPPFSGASVCLLNRILLSASHESSNFLWNYSHSLGPLPTEFRISYGSDPGTIDGTVSVSYGISSKLISEVLPAPGTYFVSIAAWNSSYGSFASGTSVYLTSLVGSQADITLNFR